MQNILVKTKSENESGWVFDVEIGDDNDTTTHTVSLNKNDYEKLTKEESKPEELVKKSFEFLLAREPKESILKEFNLLEISKYFPEYKTEIFNF